ncbi:MAG: uroporphyrinogen decarboxylase family protein [Planctomycetota bacterium]
MTKEMTHRERVLAAFSHRQPDRVPLDFAGGRISSMVVDGYDHLKAALHVNGVNEWSDRMMRVVKVHEPILQHFDIDTRAIFGGKSGSNADIELGPNCYRDAWGVERTHVPGSFYFEQTSYPLAGEITVADVAKYPLPDPMDPGLVHGLRERRDWIRANTDCAAVLTLPSPFVHPSQYLRGFEDWYVDLAANPTLLEALFDAVLEVTMVMARRQLEVIGQDIDIIICSDDLGAQNGLQFSRAHYQKFIKPRHAKYFRQIHELSSAKLVLHTCGSVVSIIDDLIEIGVDGLNPVQVTTAGMDPVTLKQRFGKRMVFWGAMDTQGILPHGSTQDVRRMVEERIEQMGEGGGYILAPCHNLQPDVPVDNVRAMYEHAREYVPSYLK